MHVYYKGKCRMKKKVINLSDLTVDKEVPTDKKFGELYKKIMLSELDYYYAIIKMKAIRPFSMYKPKPHAGNQVYMLGRIKNGDYPAMHVYQDGDEFIMSDDYHTYYTYLELGLDEAPCFVMGEPSGKNVVSKKQVDNPKGLEAVVLDDPTRN